VSVTRPLLRYHGGKWAIGEWIIAQMPPHEIYVEAFAGAASVLLRKERCGPEIINDLDGELVNVFRVLQDPVKAEQVRRRIALTPFARAEFDRTYETAVDDVDRACKTLARSQMGHGTDSITRSCRTGFRSKLSGSRALPSETWARWPAAVPEFVERLRGVVIENRDAAEVMLRFDMPGTLHYVDPPYVSATRSSIEGRSAKTHGYRFEMTDDDHERLAEVLLELKGMVMLSGYRSTLYDDLYGDWERLECETLADTAKPRTECLWFNAAAWERSRRQQSLGFDRMELQRA
jgi:DNA adenine methylase